MTNKSHFSPRADGTADALRHALKGEARRIKREAAQRGKAIALSAALEEVARRRGFRDWNALSAHIDRGDDLTRIESSPDHTHEGTTGVMHSARQTELVAPQLPDENRSASPKLTPTMSTPYPSALTIATRHSKHIEAIGVPVKYVESVPTSSLSGADLDFAVAASLVNEGTLIVDFLPTLKAYQVILKSGVLSETIWNPSSNEQFARQLLASTSIETEGRTYLDALRELVRSKYGDSIEVVRLRRPG